MIVRTLDAGADKPLRFLRQAPEDNPFLGVRGIRLALAQPELLEDPVARDRRRGGRHPLKVMFPMVATLEEYRQARAMIDGGRALEVGVMLEVPAVALRRTRFAREVDFFSVGTNDLTQYTMAAERGNEAWPACSPDCTRRAAADRRRRRGRRARTAAGSGCAASWRASRRPALLAGLGVRELSMAPGGSRSRRRAPRGRRPPSVRRGGRGRPLGR